MKHLRSSFTIALAVTMMSCTHQEPTPFELTTTGTSPAVFAAGFVSTALYERDLAITPTGQELIYTLGDYQQNRRCLVTIQQENDQWSAPRVLAFSGIHQDIEPFFASGGNRLFFASNRPLAADSEPSDYNIWYSDRQENGWSSPVPLGPNINTSGDEFYPSVANNGNLYFTATKEEGIGREDIYFSILVDGVYQPAKLLDSTINTPYYEFNAYISPDEQMLIFSSFGRPDGLGGGDLYIAKKSMDGHWLPAKNMGPTINSEKLDYCPFVDQERNVFYFTSERVADNDSVKIREVDTLIQWANAPQNGLGDIYQVSGTVLKAY